MKFVLNKCFGGYSVSDFAQKEIGSEYRDPDRDEAVTAKLIELIEKYGSEAISGRNAKLEIIEIPDTATDWDHFEYDGIETVIYVVDGRIFYA